MKKGIYQRSLKYLLADKAAMIAAVVAAWISVIASLLAPLYIGRAVDKMIGPGQVDFYAVGSVLELLAGIYILQSIFGWLLQYFTNNISYKTSWRLRRQLFSKINKLPLRFFDTSAHGDIVSRFVNDIDAICDGLVQGIANLLTGIVTIFGAAAFMLAVSGKMTAVVFFSALGTYFMARFITRRTQKLFRAQAKSVGLLNGYAEELIAGQNVVKAFSREAQSLTEFSALNQQLYETGIRAQFYGSLTNPTTRLVNNITYALIGVAGSLLTISGQITVGDIASFLIYASLFAKPFNDITAIFTQLQSAAASAQRVFAVLDLKEESLDKEMGTTTGQVRGDVVFEHACFSYDPARPLLKDFNLRVAAGRKIAIVGPTGAGKTTLVNLLLRFYELDGGRILLDGEDIGDWPRDELRRNFGMVLQDTWLFAGSIRDNIAYGRESASEVEIIAAAKASDAHSFIRRLPQGYDTMITDAGGNLSQGQKQLLTIARVMLADPPVLILDEATSSIDTRTEIRIQAAFLKMMEGRTSFVIAHRLSTIREADQILVMEKGDVVECGTHEQLLGAKGAYAKLYYSQFAGADAACNLA